MQEPSAATRGLDAGLDFKLIECAIGPTTTRTMNTVRRLVAKHLHAGVIVDLRLK